MAEPTIPTTLTLGAGTLYVKDGDGEYKELGKISEATFTADELFDAEPTPPITLPDFTEPMEFTVRIPRRQVERLIKKLRRLAKLCHIFQHTKSARIRKKCFKTLLAAGLIDFGGAP